MATATLSRPEKLNKFDNFNPKVDAYFKKATHWQEELNKLRGIILDCHLTEELKWGKPCYSLEGGNVVILLPLKEYCALLFCKGALLKDASGVLFRPSENTQAARQLRLLGRRDRRHPARGRSYPRGRHGLIRPHHHRQRLASR